MDVPSHSVYGRDLGKNIHFVSASGLPVLPIVGQPCEMHGHFE